MTPENRTADPHAIRIYDPATGQICYLNLKSHADYGKVPKTEFVPMLASGVCDLSGVPIYEGDIVTLKSVVSEHALFQIVLYRGMFALLDGTPANQMYQPCISSLPLIVLGNIFEDPELRLYTIDALAQLRRDDPAAYRARLLEVHIIRAQYLARLGIKVGQV